MKRSYNKIFGIGLSKTGTTSLTNALKMLGFKAEHYFFNLNKMDQLDAGTDTPITAQYKMLDKKYPNSKFINTVRKDIDKWLKSCCYHFAHIEQDRSGVEDAVKSLGFDITERIYGVKVYDECSFRKAYYKHEEDVKEYFKDRKQDILTIDICNGEGWEKLCPFLEVPIPSDPFPHSYKTDYNNKRSLDRIARGEAARKAKNGS